MATKTKTRTSADQKNREARETLLRAYTQEDHIANSKQQVARSGPGNSYNEMFAKMARQAAHKDPVVQQALARLDKVQQKIHQAAKGNINLKRGVLQQQLRDELQQAQNDIQATRRAAAQETLATAYNAVAKAHKRSRDSSTATARLANLMQAQMRYQAMSDDQLQDKAVRLQPASSDVKLMSFESRAEFDTFQAELRKRGKADVANELIQSYGELPLDGIGDPDVCTTWADYEWYGSRADEDSLPIQDPEKGGRIDVPLDWMLQGGDLSMIPE